LRGGKFGLAADYQRSRYKYDFWQMQKLYVIFYVHGSWHATYWRNPLEFRPKGKLYIRFGYTTSGCPFGAVPRCGQTLCLISNVMGNWCWWWDRRTNANA